MTAGRTVNAASHHWGTPHVYVKTVQTVFGGPVALDPCSNQFSVVRAETEYLLPDVDGLSASWDFPKIYVNPPYGKDRTRGTSIKDWLKRCAESHKDHKSEVIALIPVATNTKHWKQYVWRTASAVAFLHDTRLKFLINGQIGGKGAPMACAMVYWGDNTQRFLSTLAAQGAALDLRHSCG